MALAGINSEFNWSIKLPDLEKCSHSRGVRLYFFHERDAEESNMTNRSAKVFHLVRWISLIRRERRPCYLIESHYRDYLT